MRKRKSRDKVKTMMHLFQNGLLKDHGGNIITDQHQAIAYAMKSIGLSHSELKKAEIKNKLIVAKAELVNILRKEEQDDKGIKAEILKLFRQKDNLSDADVHQLAERLGISADDIEERIYALLQSFVAGGTSKGEKREEDFDPEEIRMGRIVEAEHSADPDIQLKTILDHLTENEKYYSEGKDKGIFPELEKDISTVQKKKQNTGGKKVTVHVKPGKDVTPKGARQLQHVYESCRERGGDKTMCAKQAWATVKRSGFKKEMVEPQKIDLLGEDLDKLTEALEKCYTEKKSKTA